MKKVILTIAAILSVMLAVVSPASAQSAKEMQDMGIKSGYLRVFADADAIQTGTPSAAQAPMMVMTGVITFEDASKIEGHLDEFVTGFSDEFFEKGYKTEDLKDFGDEAQLVTGNVDLNGEVMPSSAVLARNGEYVVIAISMGTEDTKSAEDVAEYMIDAEPSTTEVMFDENGKSTGGEFDMMPTAKDIKGMENMTPMMDMDFMDSLNATPEA